MPSVPRTTNGGVRPRRVDVAIITALAVELEAVLAYIPAHETASGRRKYNMCRLVTGHKDTYEIAVVRSLETGTGEAIEVARDVLEELSPVWLLVVGIAGGVSSDVKIGDVVVSSRIVDFSKETMIGDEVKYHVGGGPIAHEAAIIIANLPAVSNEMAGWEDLTALRPRPSGVPSRMFTGVIASSDRLVRDTSTIQVWREQVRGIMAVEMESAGVYRVASRRDVPFIAIRGISDLLEPTKNHDYGQRYASHAAASFTAAFLRTRPFPPRKQDSSAIASVPHPAAYLLARDQEPFRLQELSLTDIRGFDSLDIQFPIESKPDTDHDDTGQWTILLGANGAGKTSVLRALALALSSEEVIQALLGRLGASAPMVRIGAAQATILAICAAGDLPRIVLGSGDTGDRLDLRGNGDIPVPFVVAYGCRRGSALGGPSRDVDVESPLGAVETLFDDHAGLVHAETWLKERKLAATMTPDADQAFLDAILGTLVSVLPGVAEIRVNADAVEVIGPEIGRIPLGAMSDGYLTTAGWVIDLIARWSAGAKRRRIALDGSFHERMTGIAIIDEIDLHLHPRWQRDVVTSIRRAFPRMSFIATTHNPLTLLGSKAGEVFVLRRDEKSGRIEVRQRDLSPGLGAEGVLTGEWFDLASTLDDDTLVLLARHRELLRAGSQDDKEAKALEEKLTTRLGTYAATSIDRLAQSAAAQVLDEDTRKLSAEDRQAARVKIANLLRASPRAPRPRASARKKSTKH